MVIMELTKTNYVDLAEECVKNLEKDKYGKMLLTTSKIRNLLSMISAIYNDVVRVSTDVLNEDIQERIQYLRMRFVYEAGRERSVKNLLETGEINQKITAIGDDKEKCILFCRYMEAIVAYHKFYGGKDK